MYVYIYIYILSNIITRIFIILYYIYPIYCGISTLSMWNLHDMYQRSNQGPGHVPQSPANPAPRATPSPSFGRLQLRSVWGCPWPWGYPKWMAFLLGKIYHLEIRMMMTGGSR